VGVVDEKIGNPHPTPSQKKVEILTGEIFGTDRKLL
jgi:hypothetical protein